MRPRTAEDLWGGVRGRARAEALRWLGEAVEAAARDSASIRTSFPAAGRKLGRAPLDPRADAADVHAWTIDDAARTLLLLALGDRVGEELEDLYRFGDAAERRGVLRALPFLGLGGAGASIVEDAVRSNDPRLIAAALSRYGARHLDDAAFCHAILKCVFLGIPISPLEGFHERGSPELARMLAGYVQERVAAGRDVTPEVWHVIDSFPPADLLEAIEAELDHPDDRRRRAARHALDGSRVAR